MNSSAASPRLLVLALALFALILAWGLMTRHAENVPWYRHAESNFPALADALALNTGVAPARLGEPGLLTTYLLALDWRMRHGLGLLPAWNIPSLGESPDPLPELRSLVRLERLHSRELVLLLILAGGALACAVVPGLESGCFTVVLLAGAAGLLYHGLIVQPELLGCGLGGVLALLGVWLGTAASRWRNHHLGLFLAGLCGGLGALAQASGILHLLVCYAWCWLAALTAPALRPGPPGLRAGVLPVISAMLLLWLAHEATQTGATTAVAGERLRALALLASLLPLLTLWIGPGRFGAFLRERAAEFALLVGGALAALAFSYLALRAILPAQAALTSWAAQLELLFYPGPFWENLLTAPPGIAREVVRFVRESPFLYAGAMALTLTVGLQREVPGRTKAFLGLLLAGALAHTWQLAHGSYTESAAVGLQVPLLLLCAIAVLACGPWPQRSGHRPWLAPLLLTAAVVLLITVPLRLRVKSPTTRPDDSPGFSGHTLTYLYDHHAHPPAFRQMMREYYGDRAGFERAFGHSLSDPARRQ